MFSNTAEYALRAIVFLAADPAKPATALEIAAATKVSSGYLAKVLQNLGRAGLVIAQRGPTGGFTLARTPDKISVLDVVNAVDPIHRITECPLHIPSHAVKLCKLHARLDYAIGLVETAFRESSIAEMLETSPERSLRVLATVDRRPIPDAPAAGKRGRPRK